MDPIRSTALLPFLRPICAPQGPHFLPKNSENRGYLIKADGAIVINETPIAAGVLDIVTAKDKS